MLVFLFKAVNSLDMCGRQQSQLLEVTAVGWNQSSKCNCFFNPLATLHMVHGAAAGLGVC